MDADIWEAKMIFINWKYTLEMWKLHHGEEQSRRRNNRKEERGEINGKYFEHTS